MAAFDRLRTLAAQTVNWATLTRGGCGSLLLGRDASEPGNAMPESHPRRLTAILATDIAGYSRLVENDDEGTLARWKAHWHALVEPNVKEFHGRIVRVIGDGAIVEFASVVDAVRCAVEIQRGMTLLLAVIEG